MPPPKRIKVLHLTTHLNIGGITTYLFMAGSRFVRMGHEVAVLSSGGEMVSMFEAKQIRCFQFPIRTKSELCPRLYWYLPDMVRLVRKEGFHLLHAHSRVTQVLAHLISFFTKVPYVTTAHGYYRPKLGRRMFPCWGRRVVAVSPLVAEELEKSHRVDRSMIRVVENAVDIEELETRLGGKNPAQARTRLGIPEDAVVLGCVSRLVRDKGHEYLIYAAKELQKKYPQLFLLLAGEGREKKRLEKLIRKLRMPKQVLFTGSVPDVTELLAATDFFVHPATFREGFGLSMVEAMVAKIPVIATDIWAINTIIRNRVNGFLVSPKNPGELADTIEFILQNPVFAASCAENAYDSVTRLYSIERMVSELETVYQEVLS